jgi:molecular chaperone GrpE
LQRRASLKWDAARPEQVQHPQTLTLPADHIAAGLVIVFEHWGEAAGFAVVVPRDDGRADIDGPFVEPDLWRGGSQIPAGQGELEVHLAQAIRMADLSQREVVRKRAQRDQEDQRLQVTCSTLGEILPVVDNFDRARQQLNPQGEEAQALHRSYQNLYKQLVDVFKQLGVSPMRVEGETFDPNLHEAVMREPSDEHPEDVVTAELQRGYQLDGRVLRHALVKVSMGPGPAAAEGPAGGESA